jgi:predicted DNA-binding transcriptional regulator AlpA
MDHPTGFHTLGQVCDLTGLCRSTIYRLRLNGQFVEARRLSGGRIGFWKPAVQAWQARRAEAREAAGLRPVMGAGRPPRNGRTAPARRSRWPA